MVVIIMCLFDVKYSMFGIFFGVVKRVFVDIEIFIMLFIVIILIYDWDYDDIVILFFVI